ncbi:MAG: glycosyltransferase [Thermoplasmatota archaeon]
MKIGYVIDKFPKVSETFIYNEVKGLNKKQDLRVFSIEDVDEEVSEDIEIVYGEKFYRKGIEGIGSFLKGNLLDRSVIETYYNMVASKFRKHAQDLNIIHRHFPTNSVVYYLANELEIPYTITTHARDIFSEERYGHLEELLKGSAKIVTISDYNKRYLINEFKVPPEKVKKIHMGIDTEKFSPSPPQEDVTHILTVARLVEKKGICDGIKSVARIADDHPNLEYNIIGVGPLEEDLKDLVHKLNLENRVNLLGRVSEKKLLEEYEKADIFLLPCIVASDGDRDGIPVVLMEGMAMEKIVISTSVSGIPELIEDNKNGIIVDPNQPEKIAQKIKQIVEGELDIKSICRNARDKVRKDFNIQDQVAGMEEMFREVVSDEQNF